MSLIWYNTIFKTKKMWKISQNIAESEKGSVATYEQDLDPDQKWPEKSDTDP